MIQNLLHAYSIELGLAAIAVLLSLGLTWYLAKGRARTPFVAKPGLLSPAERAFLARLEQAVGDEYRVYPRIPLAEIIGIRESLGRRARQRAQAEIEDRCADFVLCTPQEFVVVAVIAFSPADDQPLRQLCRDCELALIPFRLRETHSTETVREQVMAALAAPNAPGLGALESGTIGGSHGGSPELLQSPAVDEDPHRCPTCGVAMIQTDTHWYCPRCILSGTD